MCPGGCGSAGEYNERAFLALDHILNEAAKLGMRVIMALGDNWIAADSKPSVSALAVLTTSFMACD